MNTYTLLTDALTAAKDNYDREHEAKPVMMVSRNSISGNSYSVRFGANENTLQYGWRDIVFFGAAASRAHQDTSGASAEIRGREQLMHNGSYML